MTLITSSMAKVKQVTTTIAKPSSNRMLSHEHDFVSATAARGTNRTLFHCITCDIYYCHMCGKALQGETINHHQCY